MKIKQTLTLSTFGLLLLTSSVLSGCATPSDTGLVTGGLIGGLAGNALTNGSPVATVAGAVGGALIGRDVARKDCYCY